MSMRRILSLIIIVVLAFLAVVMVVSARQKISPKAVLQKWFHRETTTGSVMTGDVMGTETTITTTGAVNTGTATGLSDQDKEDTANFLNSLGQK